MNDPDFCVRLKELMFFGHAAVKAAHAGHLTCAPDNSKTPDAIRAGAIIAADLLTAHLSTPDWTQVVVETDAPETKSEYVETASHHPSRIKVSLAPISFAAEIDSDASAGRFELAAALYFTCMAVAQMWAENHPECAPGTFDGEGMFWEALTGYAADKEGLEFARHLRIGGPDSPSFNRWVDEHFGDGDGFYLLDRSSVDDTSDETDDVPIVAPQAEIQRTKPDLSVIISRTEDHHVEQ